MMRFEKNVKLLYFWVLLAFLSFTVTNPCRGGFVQSDNIVGYTVVTVRKGWQPLVVAFASVADSQAPVVLSDLLGMREYVPGPAVDKEDGVEKVSFTVAGKTEVYEYVIRSPDTTPRWHNRRSDLTGEQQPVPPGTILWYYHATEKEFALTMGGTVLCVKQGHVVYSYEQKTGSLFEDAMQSLNDVSLSQDELKKRAGLFPATAPYSPTDSNSVMLVFGEKRILAQLRLSANNKINFVDAYTGDTLTEKIAEITAMGVNNPERATSVIAIIFRSIDKNLRDELSGTCTAEEWKKRPQAHYFAAIVVWTIKNLMDHIFGVFVGCAGPILWFSRRRLKNWFSPSGDKQPTLGNKKTRKPEKIRRRKSRKGS